MMFGVYHVWKFYARQVFVKFSLKNEKIAIPSQFPAGPPVAAPQTPALPFPNRKKLINIGRGFPKTSVFGKATINSAVLSNIRFAG
jgi:hypothetical protein